MPRADQLLYPHRQPATPLPAATLLLLRDGAGGIEVLMTRRAATASFAPGAFVFPGGGIDAADALAHGQATRRATQTDLQLTEAIAAIRESFEELGVLLARHSDGRYATSQDIAQMDRQAPFAAQCQAFDEGRGLVLAANKVFVLARWITDRDLPRRFDVPFLVARMPPGQAPVADEVEQFDPVWVSPAQALARHEAGNFSMLFPTIRTLQRLADYPDVDSVLKVCASEQALWTSCPRAGMVDGRIARFTEDEPPCGELALVCPDGQTIHPLDWQSARPVRLLRNLQRLTAANAGVMTGPGTNSYLVGDARTGYIVIDPGPLDLAHVQRLHDAAGGDIRLIVCTHSHPDHSPGALPLQALCAASPHGKPAIAGLPSAPSARPASAFTPDRVLHNQELLTLSNKGPEGYLTHTLKVIHTPGHAANHLCLVLLEDGLLFSGDHVLNGSTTVIDPPDGCMGDYIDSLDTLGLACTEHGISHVLPAHGYAMGGAAQAIGQLKAHRLRREAKIQAVMRAHPQASLDDWLPLAYDDVDALLWPVARRSLLAHVERLHAAAALA